MMELTYEERIIRDYSTPGLKRGFLPHSCRSMSPSTGSVRCDICFGPIAVAPVEAAPPDTEQRAS